MFRILKWLIAIDVLLVIISLLLDRSDWLLNTQIAFISSSAVLTASAFSYSRMVYNRLSDGTFVSSDDRQALKDSIKEEKRHMKKHRRSILQVIKDSRTSFSFLRLGAYLLLFVGFFYLSQNLLLHIPSYLIGLSLPILIVVGLLMTKKEENNETRV
ncbi:MAG: hypothetical protein HF962_06430 [Sulfurovum sp.]|nr:hypothetical protein [Sulfurovum sp.]